MSTIRLDTSFNAVLMERQFDDSQMQMPSTSRGQIDDDKTTAGANTSDSIVENADSLNTPPNHTLIVDLKIENNAGTPIEIIDSDDEKAVAKEHCERREVNGVIDGLKDSNEPHDTDKPNENPTGEHDGIDLNVGIDVGIGVKCEPKVESEDELMDLTLEVFDPNKVNNSFVERNGHAPIAESISDRSQPTTSSSAKKQTKQNDGKRFKCQHCTYTARYKSEFKRHQLVHDDAKPFKCDHCGYAARQKGNLNKHQKSHDHQKLMGIPLTSGDGLHKCTYCDQKFTKWRGLKKHLTYTHKNNQRLFNCKRCLRRFKQLKQKERHELRCQNRLYECYLCERYVTRYVPQMQQHMRTHSGEKPFECAICNRCFGQKVDLKRHLNSIHSRT